MSKCNQPAGKYMPLINRNQCEGKAACVAVCPYGVLQIDQLPVDQRATLSFFGKVKGVVHSWQQAFVVEPDLCRACALCVAVCPEGAIKLVVNN